MEFFVGFGFFVLVMIFGIYSCFRIYKEYFPREDDCIEKEYFPRENDYIEVTFTPSSTDSSSNSSTNLSTNLSSNSSTNSSINYDELANIASAYVTFLKNLEHVIYITPGDVVGKKYILELMIQLADELLKIGGMNEQKSQGDSVHRHGNEWARPVQTQAAINWAVRMEERKVDRANGNSGT